MGIAFGITVLKLEHIQNEAARIATGATKLVSVNNLYREIYWESFIKRRHDHKLTLFYKMYHHLASEYLTKLMPYLATIYATRIIFTP